MKKTNELRDVVQQLRNEANHAYTVARRNYLDWISTGEESYLAESEKNETIGQASSRVARLMVEKVRIDNL